MAEQLKYHKQNEGWKHEWLADRHCVCIMRPQEIGGGFVTVDFERRIFGSGYGKPRQGATATEYTGKGWKDRIVRDAIDHLERLMSDIQSGKSTESRVNATQLLEKLQVGYKLDNRGTGWWLSAPKRTSGAADAVLVDADLMNELEADGTLRIVMLTTSMRAELPK